MHATLQQRGSSYADIADNSRVFTDLMQAMGVEIPIDMGQVQFHCMAMISTKMARFATGDRFHEDTFLDIAGYAILIAAHHRRMREGRD